MDDEADLKKILEVLKNCKNETLEEFETVTCENTYNESYQIEGFAGIEECPGSVSSKIPANFFQKDPISSLKTEEKSVVELSNDSELKKLLILNRTKKMQLMQLYKQFKDLLMECKQNILDKSKVISQLQKSSKMHILSTGAWRLGAPYFKDKQLYSSPPNEDALEKIRSNELSIYDMCVLQKWTCDEYETLVKAVKVNYNINQQNEIKKQLKECAVETDSGKVLFTKLEERLLELKDNHDSEVPPRDSDKNINWMRVAEMFIKEKHSDAECRSVWHLYLHPTINKDPWTKGENVKLRELVEKYKFQHWDKIAMELGTNRTCFTVCTHYFANLHDRHKKGEFSAVEDKKLMDLVSKYRLGMFIPWVKIVKHFENRTRAQLHHRYTYFLSQANKKKGKFTNEEDILLMICVDRFGRNYKKCADYLPNRSMVQCKSRYITSLQQSLKKGSWTLEEDETILKYVKEHGSKHWKNLQDMMKRTRGQLRQRYFTIKQFLEQNPDKTVADVVRRRQNKEVGEGTYRFIRLVADQYKSKPIPTLKEIRRAMIRNKNGSVSISDADVSDEHDDSAAQAAKLEKKTMDIDHMLTDFFCNSFKMTSSTSISSQNLKKGYKDVERLLDIWKVDLDIPVNLDEYLSLDNLDIAILMKLSQQRTKSNMTNLEKAKSITDLVPPNLHSTVALRSLLIKHLHFTHTKNQKITGLFHLTKSSCTQVKYNLLKYMSKLDPEEKLEVEADRALFYRRFQSLLQWPAVMSLQEPSRELTSIVENLEHERVMSVNRTYSRVRKLPPSKDANVKKLKITEIPNTMNPPALKLTPVTNNSVIENLLRDKSKKLFCFDKIQCGKDTKAIIREVKLDFGKQNCEDDKLTVAKTITAGPSTQTSYDASDTEYTEMTVCEDAVSNTSDEDDKQDLQKLDQFLMKQNFDDPEEDTRELIDLQKLNIFLKSEHETESDNDWDES